MRNWLGLTVVAALVAASPASAAVIDFETLTGPSLFITAGPMQSIDFLNVDGTGVNVNFTGGVILDQTTNLPANQTSLYGTASFDQANPPKLDTITVTFSSPVSNFFMDVYNGLTVNIDYQVADNMGNSALFTLPPNLSSGTTLVGFAATGSIITIRSLPQPATEWDFFIDNIHFNEPLPPGLAPEPGSLLLLGAGIVGLLATHRRKRDEKER
jgi:hypothetical protein